MKTLYLDIFSGISGDMFLGALLDLEVDFARVQAALQPLDLAGCQLCCARGEKGGITGTKFDVRLIPTSEHEHVHADGARHAHPHTHDHGAPPADEVHTHEHEPACLPTGGLPSAHGHAAAHGGSRDYRQIRALIERSPLSDWVKQKAIAVFHRIATAEGRIHGQAPEDVHFHEVGALDSIVDVVGGCVALELLGKPRVLAGPVVEGTGWIHCAHGRFPLPAPATLAILGKRGIALSQCEEPHELVTPTGAALLAEFAESFAPMQGLVATRIGYGLGTRDLRSRPNVLRAILGEAAPASAPAHDWETDRIAVLETNLDDVNAEWLGQLVDKALGAGALDIFHTPIQMKKSRPGVLLTVLCAATDADRFAELILRETTAFGVRVHLAERRKLRRELITVPTPFGEVTVKLGHLDGRLLQVTPEYESCRALADRAGVAVREVYAAALRHASAALGSPPLV
jgi:hypothetical protein